jgi:hypothetical protein
MKIRNKLILSCAALAAVATTAVSTTFAWYTSNTEVTADGIKAKTDNNGADTLLISETGAKGTWGNSITFTKSAEVLKPVEYTAASGANAGKAAGTFKTWNSSTHTVAENAIADISTTEDGVQQYTFYIKDQTAESATDIYVKSITAVFAKNDDWKAKDVLATDGLGTYASSQETDKSYDKSTYEVSLQRALDFEFVVQEADNIKNTDDKDSNTGAYLADWTNVSASTYAFDKFADITDTLTTSNDDYNAHTYYNKVLGQNISTTDPMANITQLAPASATTAPTGYTLGDWKAFQAKTTAVYKVTLNIFLNGWDIACFDAVQGQNFTLAIEFTTVNTSGATHQKLYTKSSS